MADEAQDKISEGNIMTRHYFLSSSLWELELVERQLPRRGFSPAQIHVHSRHPGLVKRFHLLPLSSLLDRHNRLPPIDCSEKFIVVRCLVLVFVSIFWDSGWLIGPVPVAPVVWQQEDKKHKTTIQQSVDLADWIVETNETLPEKSPRREFPHSGSMLPLPLELPDVHPARTALRMVQAQR